MAGGVQYREEGERSLDPDAGLLASQSGRVSTVPGSKAALRVSGRINSEKYLENRRRRSRREPLVVNLDTEVSGISPAADPAVFRSNKRHPGSRSGLDPRQARPGSEQGRLRRRSAVI